MDIKLKLAQEFNLKLEYSANIVDLIADGNTIPFIARYRKEMHGACDDQVIREFADRLGYLQNLLKRKEEVKNSIVEQDKWTQELAASLDKAETLTEVEDIYRPYKQKKKTRASVAIERGLEPLADLVMAQELQTGDVLELCAPYVDAEKGVETPQDALNGAKDIIAERISDDAALRKTLRALLYEIGQVACKLDPKDEKNPKKQIYEMYAEFSEKVSAIPAHRILAINRGEKDECLKVSIVCDTEAAHQKIKAAFQKESIFSVVMDEVVADAYKRLIFPSIENEVRGELTDMAAEQAIKMFEVNLRPLLLQPPLKARVIMGLDPGFRTGCKVAVIDTEGNVLDTTVVFPTMPQRVEESKRTLLGLINKHKVDVISIGNGTASKETEIFTAEMIGESTRQVQYIIVNEAGASVYSASKLGAEEFPDLDLTARSAVSIARRLLDPLAELIKIDVKSIGVGQYQHDMPQKRLSDVLGGVVEDCVNSVGVDLNTASYSLLSYVSGLNLSIAKNIVEHRKKGRFVSRRELLKVNKLGPKAFEQCAGFLRIRDGEDVLDNTSVHPESYEAAQKLLTTFGYGQDDVRQGKLTELKARVAGHGAAKLAGELGIGEPTLHDIVDELLKPGRDIRDALPPPVLRADLLDMKDLKVGMELTGTVRNVIDFGAFVDIGVHHDGLVHISEMSDNYIKHPSALLKVGDVVKVRVIGVDLQRQQIKLSMRSSDAPRPQRREGQERPRGTNRDNRQYRDNRDRPSGNRDYDRGRTAPQKEESLEDKLKALQSKFSKK